MTIPLQLRGTVVLTDGSVVDVCIGEGSEPKLVITDSQAFQAVNRDTPEDILLTSFSILFARYKGNLAEAVRGAAMLDKLQNGDSVLISEGCTHHRQCDDIGTVKIPRWLGNYTGKQLAIATSSGKSFPASSRFLSFSDREMLQLPMVRVRVEARTFTALSTMSISVKSSSRGPSPSQNTST